MPIKILSYTEDSESGRPEALDCLCSEEWELPIQIQHMKVWLETTGRHLEPGSYVADIGFSPRDGAFGGGGLLTREAMAIMGSIGMDLYFSEYPSGADHSE